MAFKDELRKLRIQDGLSQVELAKKLGLSNSTISMYERGERKPDWETEELIADFFNVNITQLRGKSPIDELPPPNITEDVVTFPVLGSVAAGYDHFITQDSNWSGATIDVPREFLRGRPKSDYFILQIEGNSMYPLYMDGDCVLVLRQSTLDRSGQIGVVVYNDDCATIKRIDYVKGEDWMRLVPINPQYPPEMVTGERLEHCRVLGIPKLLIREIVE